MKQSTSKGVTTILVYMDDIIVIGNEVDGMENLKKCLVKEFKIKELERLKHFLEIEVAHSRQETFVHFWEELL